MQEINFPEDVRKMLWILIGEMPLQGRENLAYASKDLYLDFGRGIRDLSDEIQRSIVDASTSLPKDVGDQYVRGLSLLTDDGGVNHLSRMIDDLDDIARGQVDHSINIQAAKWEIIAEIVMLLIELALLAALAAITGGTSLSRMALARARSRLAVLIIIDRLLRMSHLAPTLTEAFEEALQTLAVRLAQIALNPGGRKPDGIDWKDVGKAAAFGAVVGLFGSVLEVGGQYFKNLMKKGFDDFDHFAKNHPNWNITLNGAGELGGAFVVGAVSESAGEYLIQGAFEGDWDFRWETFVGSGTSAVFDVVVGGAALAGALWLHNKFASTTDFGTANDSTRFLDDTRGGGPGATGSARAVPTPAGPMSVPAPVTAPVPAPVTAPAPTPTPTPTSGVPTPVASITGTPTSYGGDTRTPGVTPPTTSTGSAPFGNGVSGRSPLPGTDAADSDAITPRATDVRPHPEPGTRTRAGGGESADLGTRAGSGTNAGSSHGADSVTRPRTGPHTDPGSAPSPHVGSDTVSGTDDAPRATATPSASPTAHPAFEAARAAAQPVTRAHTWVDPVSTPADPARPGETTQYAVRSLFEARRFEYDGQWVTDLTVQVTVPPDGLPGEVWDKVRAGVEEYFNAAGHRLPDGDLLHVTVEQTPVPAAHPNALQVSLVGHDQPMTRTAWWADAEPIDYAHEIAHQLGLRDEARGGDPAASARPDVPGSLLGDYTRPAPAGLAQGGLRGRHLALLGTLVGDLPTATPDTSGGSSERRPATTTADLHPGAEPRAPRPPVATTSTAPPQSGTAQSDQPAPPPAAPGATVGDSGAAPGPDVTATVDGDDGGDLRGDDGGDHRGDEGHEDDDIEVVPRPDLDPTPPGQPTPTPHPAPTSGPRERHWINSHLERTRPPRLDLTATAPAPIPARTTFDDGTAIPAYIDNLSLLLPAVPADQLAELLVNPVTFGQSDVALRGVPDVLAQIEGLLDSDASLRPADPGRSGPPGAGLMADVRMTLTRRPRTLTGTGRQFPYRDAAKRTRVLHVSVRHYGNWSRFADDYGDPSKIDTMERATLQAGQSKGVQSVTQLGLGGPFLAPASTLAFGGFGRLAVRGGVSRKVGYGQTDQVSSQLETRTLDGSKIYLDDVYLDVRVTDADGQPVTDAVPGSRSFAVRDGLMVRLPDSAVKASKPGRIPRTIPLDHNSQYRLVRTEGFGPVSRIRDWAAAELGVKPGSTAYQELDTFFSTDSFHRHARLLAQGRLATAPLFADDRKRTPLGFFVVERVVATEALLIDETAKAELRDINTSTVRNDRGLTKGAFFSVDGVLGPAFNFLDLGNLTLRLQFGPAFRYLYAASSAAQLGGFGALKTSGQVKGDATGLYLVKKTVHVRRSGSGGPPRLFQTWSVDRMTRTEARRLAGWDDGTGLRQRHGLPEPFAPAHLTVDHPVTLGMHRVEEIAHADGRRTDGTGPHTPGRTLADAFADAVVSAVAQTHPGLVAPLDQLAPPAARGVVARARSLFSSAGRSPAHRFSDADAYQTAVSNTLQVLNLLSHQSLSGSMEALITTGIRIRLTEPGTLGQGHRYIWVHGDLTNRRYAGRQNDLRLRHSAPGGQRLDGQGSRKRALAGGADAQLGFRDPDSLTNGGVGVPDNSGVLSIGWRSGTRHDDESGFGYQATNEPMSVSTGPSHLYRYDLSLTVTHGGYWRFRGLLRGFATLGLLGTQPFVFSRPQDVLIGTTAHGTQVRGGPVRGQVLISVPDQHTPSADPHRPGAANPYPALRAPLTPAPMTRRRAFALASGDLTRPDGRAAPRGSQLFRDLQNHPFLTINVVVPPGLLAAVSDVVATASGGAWQLTEEGAPAREAILRTFQPQSATADFDQSSGALGLGIAGLMGKSPYGTLWATFRHFTTVTGVQAVTSAIAMDTEMVLGSGSQAAGKSSRTVTHSFGGQLTYVVPHGPGPGPVGVYGIVLNPWSESSQQTLNVSRSVVADLNLKGFGHQVLITGTVEHWAAMASSMLGTAAAGRSFVPSFFAGAAGSVLTVPGGWLAHLPEKSAHRLNLIDDGMGPVPLYTRDPWSPQPWMRGNSFGTYPVNSLDPTTVLADFQRRVARLGLDEHTQERIRTLATSRVLRAMNRELTGTGAATPARSGGWGWGSVRVGRHRARVRAELVPGTPGLLALDHGTEMEENRRAVEVVQQGAEYTSGKDLGILTGEQVGTGDPTAVASGPTYTETGTSRRQISAGHSVATSTTYRAASTEPHAEVATPYQLRLTLEFDEIPQDTAGQEETPVRDSLRRFTGRERVTETGDVGTLVEHVPLSLMTPVPGTGAPAPDPRLAPPDLTVTTRPRSGPRHGQLSTDVRHGDGTMRPFTFPENGFHVRRIVGLDHLHEANERALAEAYGIDLTGLDDGRDRGTLLKRARGTALTRPGGAPAQALEDGTTNTALSTFYDRTVTPSGYQVPGLTHRGPLGTDSARLALLSKPDFGAAVLLSVADGKKLEVLRETAEGVGTSVSQENTQDSALGGGVLVRSEATGVNQIGAAASGPYASDSDGTPVGADQLSSVNVKPSTGRSFLFAVPTDWLSVAQVHRGIKDARVGRFLSGTFGIRHPGVKAVSSRTYALAWVREDIARELGLISDRNFPDRVAQAWDAVGKASKAWTSADQAYWKKRRTALPLREERDAARDALAAARTVADEAARTLAPLQAAADAAAAALQRARDSARQARETARTLNAAADDYDTTRAALDTAVRAAERDRAAAQAAVDTARDELATLQGWAELPGADFDTDTLTRAETALTTATRSAATRAATAARTVDAARRAHQSAATRLGNAEQSATGSGTVTGSDPAPDPDRARQTALTLVADADERVGRAEEAQDAAARRLVGPARADADARAARAAATVRRDAAQAAFDARRAELDALRATAETAASEFHRIRAATDQLTRWHQLAATDEGTALLDGLPEPAPVTPPPAPAAPPNLPAPPAPRYTRSADGARLTSPDDATYALVDVPRDGDAFFRALAEGLARNAAPLLAEFGVDAASPTLTTALRALLTARLSDPADADLLAAVAPDDGDRFTAAEIQLTGPAPDLAPGTPGRREFDALGVVPHSAALDDGARARLAAVQLTRPGNAGQRAGWDHGAADLLPVLAARTFGIDLTVVRGDGTFYDFTPGDGDRSGRLAELLDQDGDAYGAGRDRPHLVLFLDDEHYQLADPVRQQTAGPSTSRPGLPLAEALLAALPATGPRPWADPGQLVPLDDLAGLGVVPTAGQTAQAVLLGGSSTVRDLGLTPAQHLTWLLTRGPGADWERTLATAADVLGVEIVVVTSDGRHHTFGTARHGSVRLSFDGMRYFLREGGSGPPGFRRERQVE